MTSTATKVEMIADRILQIQFGADGIDNRITLHGNQISQLSNTMRESVNENQQSSFSFRCEAGTIWIVSITSDKSGNGKTVFSNASAGRYEVSGELEHDLFSLISDL